MGDTFGYLFSLQSGAQRRTSGRCGVDPQRVEKIEDSWGQPSLPCAWPSAEVKAKKKGAGINRLPCDQNRCTYETATEAADGIGA